MSDNNTVSNSLYIPSIGSNGDPKDKKSIQSSLIESLKVNSDYDEKDAKKIATEVAKGLNGKRKYTEEDVFEAAVKAFDPKGNDRLFKAIDLLNGDVNVDYKYEAGEGTKAIWREAISQSSQGDSSDIVKREITQGPLSPYVTKNEGTPRDVIDRPTP